MPHCIIEYSAPLSQYPGPEALISAVFHGALQSGLFHEEDIKCRTLRYENYCVGTSRADFVHVTMHLLPGRTEALKKAVTGSILDALIALDIPRGSFTVDISELDAAYIKHVR
jgi:5-carboxymethyl-2-hydroxymuconate isomerase